MKNVIFSFVLLTLVSCASYNPGNYADVMKGDHPKSTPINADIVDTYSYKPFSHINFTFGNKGTKWRRVKKITVTNIAGSEEARIIVGSDLVSWAKGTSRRAKIDAHNTQMVLGAVAGAFAIGAGAAYNGGNNGLAGGLAVSALTVATISDFNNLMDGIDGLELAKLVPPEHLYTPFAIPPGLYISKWLVVQMPVGKLLTYLDFDVEYLSGEKVSYRVKLDDYARKGK